MKYCYFCIAIIAVFIIVCPTYADDLSFTVSPMATELSLTPGTEQTQTLTVKDDRPTNADPVSLSLKVYPVDWTLDLQGNPRFATPGTLPQSCSSWMHINPQEITLRPGQTQTVRCTLHIPADAQGTFHSMLMFQAAPSPTQIRQQMVAVSGRIGASLYVSVGPQAHRARITALTVTAQKTVVMVENTGTCQLRLKGVLKLVGLDGRELAQAPLPVALLLPGVDGVRQISLDTPSLPVGISGCSATVLLDYGGDVLLGARTRVTAPSQMPDSAAAGKDSLRHDN